MEFIQNLEATNTPAGHHYAGRVQKILVQQNSVDEEVTKMGKVHEDINSDLLRLLKTIP